MEGRLLRLRGLLHETEHLGAAGLIDARGQAQLAHGIEEAEHADPRHVGRVLGHVEGDLDVALRREVVHLVGPHLLERPHEAVLVHEVPVVQDQPVTDGVDAPGVERAAAPHEAMHLVPLFEEELGQITPVLPRDPGDECLLARHASLLQD
jgi:hypothetical protein